jgi:hypothetical protein
MIAVKTHLFLSSLFKVRFTPGRILDTASKILGPDLDLGAQQLRGGSEVLEVLRRETTVRQAAEHGVLQSVDKALLKAWWHGCSGWEIAMETSSL